MKRPGVGQVGTFEALSRIFLNVKRARQGSIRPHGVTLKQFHVLGELDRVGDLNPSRIADLIYADRPTAAVVIRNMERKGWIERRVDPEDARRFIVSLSAQGRSKLDTVRRSRVFADLPLRKVFGCLSTQERAQLRELLNRVSANLDRVLSGE